jgi:hypothetical protein
MAVLRSESRATRCSASGLRAGPSIARSFSGSRAWCSRRSSVRPSGRGPRVPSGRGSFPSARAVPVVFASGRCPAHAGAQRGRFVGGASAQGLLVGSGVGMAPGVASRSNYVFSRTAGDFAVLNQSLLAAAG